LIDQVNGSDIEKGLMDLNHPSPLLARIQPKIC